MGKKLENLVGKVFDKLTVLELDVTRSKKGNGRIWKCICECGNIKYASTGRLNKNKYINSCGCAYKERTLKVNLEGQRFSKLVVLSESPIRTKHGSTKWLCQCDCGNTRYYSGPDLIRGHSTSCGCSRRKEKGEASKNMLFNAYIKKAEKRGWNFELDRDYFLELTSSNCFYCNEEPKQVKKTRDVYGEYQYNGVDRIDSSNGYIIGNVVPCCGKCNRAKSTMSQEDFFIWTEKIYKNNLFRLGEENG